MNPFSARLRSCREHKGLSQAELARRSGVNQQTISRYEAGEREPTWINVVAIADALGVPLDTFRGAMPPVVKKAKGEERQEGGDGDE